MKFNFTETNPPSLFGNPIPISNPSSNHYIQPNEIFYKTPKIQDNQNNPNPFCNGSLTNKNMYSGMLFDTMIDPASGSSISLAQYEKAYPPKNSFFSFNPIHFGNQKPMTPFLPLSNNNNEDGYDDENAFSVNDSIEENSEYDEPKETEEKEAYPVYNTSPDLIKNTDFFFQNPYALNKSNNSPQKVISNNYIDGSYKELNKEIVALKQMKYFTEQNQEFNKPLKLQKENVESIKAIAQSSFEKYTASKNNKYNLMIKISQPYENAFPVTIDKNDTIEQLKSMILDKMIEMKLQNTLESNSFLLMTKHKVLNKSSKISEIGITSGDTIHVIDKETIMNSNSGMEFDSFHNESLSEEFKPILTKKGYKTSPDIEILRKMSFMELYAVKDFEIYSEHGVIHYNKPCNLIKANLDDIFTLEPGNIIMNKKYLYEHSDFFRNATINVYNIKPHTQESLSSSIEDNQLNNMLTLDYQEKNYKEVKGECKEYLKEEEEFIYSLNIINNLTL